MTVEVANVVRVAVPVAVLHPVLRVLRTRLDWMYTSTVTTEQLAERVKALIDDLHSTAGHGLIGT